MRPLEEYKDAADAAADAGDQKLALELLDRYRNHRLAQLWCQAEQRIYEEMTEAEREAVHKRVRERVYLGPGDMAVAVVLLLHELRDVDDKQREIFEKTLGKGAQARRLHVYDSFTAEQLSSGGGVLRLFSNANIGYDEYTNLQIAEQISFDNPAFLTSWYITAVPPIEWTPGYFTLEVNGRRVQTSPATRLLDRPQRLSTPVGVRMSVRIQYASGQESPKLPPAGVRVYAHLEGWRAQSRF